MEKSYNEDEELARALQIFLEFVISPEAYSIVKQRSITIGMAWIQLRMAIDQYAELQDQQINDLATVLNQRLAEAGLKYYFPDASSSKDKDKSLNLFEKLRGLMFENYKKRNL